MSRRVGFFAAFLAAGLAISAPAAAQTFSRTNHTGLFHPLVADLNNDGRMDLAGTTFPGTNAGVLLSSGPGTFAPLVAYPAGGDVQTAAAGDLDGDGDIDLVVTINQADIGLALLMNNGNGTFAAPVHLPNVAGADTNSAAVTDLDDDGKQDIVIAHNMSCYVSPCRNATVMSVMMGNGDGTFEPTRIVEVGVGMNKIAVGDFNKDGVKDLAIGAGTARLYRLQGLGDGTFTQLETLTLDPDPNFIEITDVDVADFNRDGNPDLVVPFSTNSSRLAVLIGNGDGTWRTPLIMQEALDVPQHVAVADYNGDGFEDIAYGFGFGGAGLFAIRNGNGNGTFQAGRRYEVPPPLSSIGTVGMVTGHFNADTKPDLALSIGGAAASFRTLINTTGVAPPPTPGAPTLISPAQDATPEQVITFDWTDVAGATQYRIQVDDSSNFSSPLIFDRIVDVSQFTAPYFLNIRRHWWRVRALNSAGVAGPFSATRRFTPSSGPAPTVPVAPTLLRPADGATEAQPLTLDWSDVTDAANYRIQIDTSSSFTSPLTVDQTVFGSQFTVPTLAAGTQYWWRVRGTNSAGTAGPFSVVRSFTPTALPPPAAPTLRTPVDGATPAQPVAFDWDAVSGAVNYRIQIDDSSDFSSPVVNFTNEASAFTAPTLAATQHWWRVQAINSAGTAGPFSAVWSVTPQGTAPPPPPAASLNSLALNPTSVTGGGTSQGSVTLTSAAPSGGAVVALSSSNPGVAGVPVSVSVTSGATSASFSVSTSAVGANTSVSITGSYNGTSRTGTLTVTPVPPPPPPPGGTATLTVTASGRGGERVTSSPAGINVAVGSSQSASFTTGTSITLSVTNGRDAIWSGACSSGGNKRRTCVFTFNAAASVSANVQ